MTKHFNANSTAQAWNKVNEIFPTDYEHDSDSSKRAGYPVYRSTADGHWYDYICDLGDHLEINLSNGDTVNVWIKDDEADTFAEPTEAEVQQMVDDTKAAEAAGKSGWSHIAPKPATIYSFCVMHTDYDPNKAEHDFAEALNHSDDSMKVRLASDFVSAWCDANDVPWGSIEIFHKPYKYNHSKEGNYHFTFDAVVTLRTAK